MKKFNLFISLFLSGLIIFTSCHQEIPIVHNFEETWTTDSYYHWHKCTDTGCDEVSEKGEHTFSKWITIKESTETEEGSLERTCSVCGYKQYLSVPKLAIPKKSTDYNCR